MNDYHQNITSRRVVHFALVLISFLVGGIAMYIAWQHNPQCEIHCDGNIQWRYWLIIGLSWAITTYVALLLAVWTTLYIVSSISSQ